MTRVFVVPLLPCLPSQPCPDGGDLGGTFRLVPLEHSAPPDVRAFRVEDVFWLARASTGRDLPITGSGVYTISERGAPSQRLVLELRVGGGPPRRFDSGRVPIELPFPRIDVMVTADEPTGFGDHIFVRSVPFPPKRDGTPCGIDTCDTESEICVEEQGGLGVVHRCEPVPAGCEEDRTCGCVGETLCPSPPVFLCDDRGENAIACICFTCV